MTTPTDAQLRSRLREFWSGVLDDLAAERAAAADVSVELGISLQLPKAYIDKAAKASDQIRRDFSDKPPEAEDPASPATAEPTLGGLKLVR